MAVAWDGGKIGSGGGQIIVRDALVTVVTLPRFLAPGDTGQMTVSLHNVDGLAGAYKVTLAGTLVGAAPLGFSSNWPDSRPASRRGAAQQVNHPAIDACRST